MGKDGLPPRRWRDVSAAFGRDCSIRRLPWNQFSGASLITKDNLARMQPNHGALRQCSNAMNAMQFRRQRIQMTFQSIKRHACPCDIIAIDVMPISKRDDAIIATSTHWNLQQ